MFTLSLCSHSVLPVFEGSPKACMWEASLMAKMAGFRFAFDLFEPKDTFLIDEYYS